VSTCGQSHVGACELESRQKHGCRVLVNVVICQIEVSATSRSLVQRSPTDRGVSFSVIWIPQEKGGPVPRWAVVPEERKLC
jgi:hypothetical protein